MRERVLYILHLPPPMHGASKVGEFIKNSEVINGEFEGRYIPIKSSESIGEIGRFSIKKIFYMIWLYFKVLKELLIFRPEKIYYTASTGGIAFIRDYVVTSLIRMYQKVNKKAEVYYHYHTKGLDKITTSRVMKGLLRRFLKGANIIVLSPLLKDEFEEYDYKKIYFLPNGVEDSFKNEEEFLQVVENRFLNDELNILYLSNMIKSKGYMEVLELAKHFPEVNFHFAGGWKREEDEEEFFNFIENNKLQNVKFHGFVSGDKKRSLFEISKGFVFPTKYKNEAFPLSILEAYSFGLPVFTTDEGSIPYMVDNNSGVIIKSLEKDELVGKFSYFLKNFINKKSEIYCRKKYKQNYTLDKFERNFIEIIKGENGTDGI